MPAYPVTIPTQNSDGVRQHVALLTVLLGGLCARFALIFRYRFDSDESQHMHVAWGWAHGLVQYRDVFDNHMPLFHLMTAPLFAGGNDDPRLLFAARLLMVPLFVGATMLVWFIARRLFEDDRIALVAAAITALFPPYFLGSLEYRTDDLWVLCWLGVIAVGVSRMSWRKRTILGGLLLGVAFGVSMKSVLCAGALFVAALGVDLLTGTRSFWPPLRTRLLSAASAIGLACSVPLVIALAFAATGNWKPFVYGVFEHNRIPFEHAWRVLWFVPLYFVVRAAALAILRSDAEVALVRRRLFVCLACGAYSIGLIAFWPMSSLESYLPIYPLALLLLAPWVTAQRRSAALAFAVIELIAVVITARPWRNEAQREIALVREVVALTGAHEPVMDLKGESVFRARPWYFGIEAITNVKLRLGIIQDDIAATLISTATHVVVSEGLPRQAKQFVLANYVEWGSVHIAGVRLPPVSEGMPVPFRIAISGNYLVTGDDGPVVAVIDGKAVVESVHLAPGLHTMVASAPVQHPMVVWEGSRRWPAGRLCAACDAEHTGPYVAGR